MASTPSVTSPASVANGGALLILAIYLGVVIWRGNTTALWKAVSDSGGFLKWAGALWAVRVATSFKGIQPLGAALWGLVVLGFVFQVMSKSKQK